MHVVFYCLLRLAPRCLASTLVSFIGHVRRNGGRWWRWLWLQWGRGSRATHSWESSHGPHFRTEQARLHLLYDLGQHEPGGSSPADSTFQNWMCCSPGEILEVYLSCLLSNSLLSWLCPSIVIVYLSVCTKSTSSPDPGCLISCKYLQTVKNFEKLPCLCFFLLDTLYKHLKSCVLSWHYGHTYRPHPDTWPHDV